MTWRGKQLIGDAQTNIAGPGFHAAVAYFLELFAARGGLKLSVKDETGFFADRNFDRLCREYFYPWLSKVLNAVAAGRGDREGRLVCWPSDYYLPEDEPGIVMTHIRSFGVREIQGIVRSGLTASFAKDFFVWGREEKDSWYFRNCALVLLNQQCYFRPSSRSSEDLLINQEIIRLLEKALKMDPGIPFPIREYREVCGLDGHEPVSLKQVTPMTEIQPVGCRRGLLYRTIGRLRFAVPGYFLYDARAMGNAERYFDAGEKDWHEYYICAIKTQEAAQIREEPFLRDTVLRTREFTRGTLRGKMAVYRPMRKTRPSRPDLTDSVLVGEQVARSFTRQKEPGQELEEDVYTVAAQIAYLDQLTIVSISSNQAVDVDWAAGLIEKIQAVPER